MKEESTHLVFNYQGIFISPNIQPVFSFLMDIEKETESFLGFNNKLGSIRASYLEMLDFVEFLSNKLVENNIDFKYTFKENPETIAEKLEFYLPLRSQVIVLFASLEVLFTLHMAYENETADEDQLRSLTMDKDNTKKFLNSYLLNDANEYYKNNKGRLAKIDSTKLRGLRNSLTHFFSIGHGGLSLSPDILKDRSRKLENLLKKDKKGFVVFISENDLYSLIKAANILRMRKWSIDFQESPSDFKRKMQKVIELVNREGSIIIPNNKMNF